MSAHSDKDRARDQAKRDAFRAQGLTSKGKPRKGRYKPTPAQQTFVANSFKRKEPTVPKRNETEEQRLARGASIRGTPLARRLEKAVAKRVERMKDEAA